jgi:beta-mannosidase
MQRHPVSRPLSRNRSVPCRQFLSESWQFQQLGKRTWLPAKVPGCVHTDLLRHRLIPDPFYSTNEHTLKWIEEADWRYRCKFNVDKRILTHDKIELVVKGLDTLATLSLNGIEIGRSQNMFIGHRIDVAHALKRKANLLEIHFHNPMTYIRSMQQPDDPREWCDPVGGSSLIRKEARSFGWDWGPRLPSSGIYLPIYLEAWSMNRIESVHVKQVHETNRVHLTVTPELATSASKVLRFQATLSLRGALIAESHENQITVNAPELWWPNGLGDHPLYDLEVRLVDKDERILDVWSQKIGLRTIELDRHPDEFGESFQFKINGRTIFAKGANWIPAHSFSTEASDAIYDNLLTSACKANMNMIRVWGGGIYEKEIFYDLCDKKGLLLWHDFMFACAYYRGKKDFLDLVIRESEYQVKRIRNHASLALWCGNNELEQLPHEILKTPERKKAYDDIFYSILPDAVEKYDGSTPYWPSSPHNPDGYERGHNNEGAGDSHFWDVWFARKPVKTYEQKKFRFCSEFGMQSFSSPEVASTYCNPEEFNIFGPSMESHQKNNAGNLIILEYIFRRYRFPTDYASLAYLSQLNQAYCMKIGVEHFRRSMPRTMGSLYWQLNDCWPVASWSSLEFGGRWKALHYEAKRFYAPALISIHIPGDETLHIGNMLRSTIHNLDVHTVYDGPSNETGIIHWSLGIVDGKEIRNGKKRVVLRYGEATKHLSFDFDREIKRYGAQSLYFRAELMIDDRVVSRQVEFFTAPRFINFKRSPIQSTIRSVKAGEFELTLKSKVFQHQVGFHFKDIRYQAEDNFIDLFPGEKRIVHISTEKKTTSQRLKTALKLHSLVDCY